jgi:hypothetical protein
MEQDGLVEIGESKREGGWLGFARVTRPALELCVICGCTTGRRVIRTEETAAKLVLARAKHENMMRGAAAAPKDVSEDAVGDMLVPLSQVTLGTTEGGHAAASGWRPCINHGNGCAEYVTAATTTPGVAKAAAASGAPGGVSSRASSETQCRCSHSTRRGAGPRADDRARAGAQVSCLRRVQLQQLRAQACPGVCLCVCRRGREQRQQAPPALELVCPPPKTARASRSVTVLEQRNRGAAPK